MVARTVATEKRTRPKTFFLGYTDISLGLMKRRLVVQIMAKKRKYKRKLGNYNITSGSIERKMVAGIVATKENPQTGEKRRQVDKIR